MTKPPRPPWPYDDAKIEQAVLALLGAFEFDGGRVWKGYDFGVMEALYEKGLVTAPRGRTESVWLTEEGLQQAKAAALRMFGQ